MPGDNAEDLILSRRAAGGDGGAFALLVEKYELPLRAFLMRMRTPDPDDVAQDAFLKAWRFAGQYDGRARYSTWLTRIAWRCRIDAARRHRIDDYQSDHGGSASCTAEIGDLLSRLEERERAALILCEGHGWTHQEAAELLAMPLGTLKSTVARAKAKCRTMWKGEAS